MHSSSLFMMRLSLSSGSIRVSGIGDDEDDEWMVVSSVGALFRCTYESLSIWTVACPCLPVEIGFVSLWTMCHVDSIRHSLGEVCRYIYVFVDGECLDGHWLEDG
mgnify:CR=1 FL=1